MLSALCGENLMSWRPGIRTEIVFIFTVLVAGVAALVGIVFLKVEERNLLQQKVKAGKQVMAAVEGMLQEEPPGSSPSSEKPLSQDLQNLSVFLAESRLFSRFSIVDPDFRILADSHTSEVGKLLRDPELEKAIAAGKVLVHEKDGAASLSLMTRGPLLFSAPLIREGKAVGGLRGELPLDDLRETLAHSQATILLYILFDVFAIIIVGSVLLSRIIVRPLKKLVQMSEKIADGNLETIGAPSGGDEVGKLFFSFNHMAARLREDRQKMEEYILTLENVNRELRRAQDEVLRSEKLASIGRLAAGIAHEVGNPTGAILGYVDLLAQGGLGKEEEKDVLERTGKEAERIRRLVRELLDFSRPSPGEHQTVDVAEVVQSTLSLLSHQKKVWKQIKVEVQFGQNLPKWRGDPHQLQQVLVNLFLNAADAMMEAVKGSADRPKRLRVSTGEVGPEGFGGMKAALPRRRKNDVPDRDYTHLRAGEGGVAPGKEIRSGIRIEVEDTGPGMSAEVQRKIFDPFFTTKPPGEGTGLGLAICLRIVESYGGRLGVRSEEGKGALFTILLPVFEEHDGTAKNSRC